MKKKKKRYIVCKSPRDKRKKEYGFFPDAGKAMENLCELLDENGWDICDAKIWTHTGKIATLGVTVAAHLED